MRIIRKASELDLDRSKSIGFVPTMGAFHEGHLELMRTAKRENDLCVVSLFVNPTQFGPGEDFEKYPRQEETDFEMAESVSVDVIFVPEVSGIYGKNTTRVRVDKVSEKWEGAHRPGHFEGVATVVAILFHIVGPKVAYFGLKDFQQCAVIRRMAEDLHFPLQLKFLETVREPDGLAMSSRNAYLSPDERRRAPALFRALSDASALMIQDPTKTEDVLSSYREKLQDSGFKVDYFELVDSMSLEPAAFARAGMRLIAAAYLGKTRLIDNRAVG